MTKPNKSEPHSDDLRGAGRSTRADQTRSRLRDAAFETVRDVGLSGASARAIATRAGVNQALVFYHFDTVSELLEAASDDAVDRAIASYREALDGVDDFDALTTIARDLHDREAQVGNVTFMAQILSGAHHDDVLARAARSAVDAWTAEVRRVVDRVLDGSVAADLFDTAGLASLVAAGFIGLELYGGVDDRGATRAIDTLAEVGHLVDLVNDLGPVARRALQVKLRRG